LAAIQLELEEVPVALRAPIRLLVPGETAPFGFATADESLQVAARIAKRVLDIVLAMVLLLVTAPLWIAVAVAVKFDSPGPVLFRQSRVGRGGRPFTLFKFRSMIDNAEVHLEDVAALNEADGPYFKVAADPRITRVGRAIRRLSVDELPQLLNVLRGEMSLVGPRPALASEVAQYPLWLRRRLDATPGLTGLWQISGRFLLPFAEGAALDVYYVDNWSLALDLKVLLRTPAVVLSGHGAR
jgi:lipopolysaccharide/colanic/teichoic acid biosynthesis glycosyltransferase